jgi:hypothetical protein
MVKFGDLRDDQIKTTSEVVQVKHKKRSVFLSVELRKCASVKASVFGKVEKEGGYARSGVSDANKERCESQTL